MFPDFKTGKFATAILYSYILLASWGMPLKSTAFLRLQSSVLSRLTLWILVSNTLRSRPLR